MKIDKEEFLKEFDDCFFSNQKLRFIKFLLDNFRGVIPILGIREAKDFTDSYWYKEGGEVMSKVLKLENKEFNLNKEFSKLYSKAEELNLKEEFQNLCLIHIEDSQII